MLETLLILNTLWFSLGFHLFFMRGHIFAKIVVPKEHRETPVMETLIMSGKFLGGFNFAFAIFNILLLIDTSLFESGTQWAIILITMAIAHGTQFASNVPVFLQNRKGHGVWQVKGLMLFIFIIDFTLMVFNAVLGIYFHLG